MDSTTTDTYEALRALADAHGLVLLNPAGTDRVKVRKRRAKGKPVDLIDTHDLDAVADFIRSRNGQGQTDGAAPSEPGVDGETDEPSADKALNALAAAQGLTLRRCGERDGEPTFNVLKGRKRKHISLTAEEVRDLLAEPVTTGAEQPVEPAGTNGGYKLQPQGTVHNLRSDAPRFVAEALKVTGHQWVALHDLALNYNLPRPNNLSALQEEIRADIDQPHGKLDDYDIAEWLIRDAIIRINRQNDGSTDEDSHWVDAIERDEDDESFRLVDGADADTLELHRQPLIRKPLLPNLFDPQTGVFADNIRAPLTDDPKTRKEEEKADAELRWSIKTQGYWPDKRIIKDEHGVTIEGHRRERIAKELGLDPPVLVVPFGEGDAGTSGRLGRAIGSNFAKPFSPADRKFIAEQLYGKPGWSMEKLGDLLHVSAMQVSRDLRGLTNVKPDPKHGGRPRKQTPPELIPAGPEQPDEAIDELAHANTELDSPHQLDEPDEPATVESTDITPTDEPDDDTTETTPDDIMPDVDEPQPVPADEPLLNRLWQFTLRPDHIDDGYVSVEFDGDPPRVTPCVIELEAKRLDTRITPSLAADLAVYVKAALPILETLLIRLDKRAAQNGIPS